MKCDYSPRQLTISKFTPHNCHLTHSMHQRATATPSRKIYAAVPAAQTPTFGPPQSALELKSKNASEASVALRFSARIFKLRDTRATPRARRASRNGANERRWPSHVRSHSRGVGGIPMSSSGASGADLHERDGSPASRVRFAARLARLAIWRGYALPAPIGLLGAGSFRARRAPREAPSSRHRESIQAR